MYKYKDKLLISLGPGCPTEDFIDHFRKYRHFPIRRVAGLFDYMITSPDSVIEFLELCKTRSKVYDAVSNRDNYLPVKVGDGVADYVYKNTLFDCMYVWHPETFKHERNFTNIVIHKLENLFNHKGKKYFIINNISSQIFSNAERAGEDPDKFIMTLERYTRIKSLVEEVFGGELILITDSSKSSGLPMDVLNTRLDIEYMSRILEVDLITK